MYRFNTDLADSTIRFAVWGETRVQYAIPRMRLIRPSSVNCTGFNWRTLGQLKMTSPPPSGGAPRFVIWVRVIDLAISLSDQLSWLLPLSLLLSFPLFTFNSKLSEIPKRFNWGNMTVRTVSTYRIKAKSINKFARQMLAISCQNTYRQIDIVSSNALKHKNSRCLWKWC